MPNTITQTDYISRLNTGAIHGLQTGNFAGAIELLEKHPNQMSERLIEVLILMMKGNDKQTENILELKANPSHGNATKRPYHRDVKEGKEWTKALIMCRAIHQNGQMVLTAENEVVRLFGGSHSAAQKAYYKYKEIILNEFEASRLL